MPVPTTAAHATVPLAPQAAARLGALPSSVTFALLLHAAALAWLGAGSPAQGIGPPQHLSMRLVAVAAARPLQDPPMPSESAPPVARSPTHREPARHAAAAASAIAVSAARPTHATAAVPEGPEAAASMAQGLPPATVASQDEEYFDESQLGELPRPLTPPTLAPSGLPVPDLHGAHVELLVDDLGRVVRVRRLEGLQAPADWAAVQRALIAVAFRPGRRAGVPVKAAMQLRLVIDGDQLRW